MRIRIRKPIISVKLLWQQCHVKLLVNKPMKTTSCRSCFMYKPKMQFSEFCNNCEKISANSKTLKKKNLKDFIDSCRKRVLEDAGFTMFSVLRLLLPHIDRSRGAYGIKEATLAKLYVKIFCLPKDGSDARRLIQHR